MNRVKVSVFGASSCRPESPEYMAALEIGKRLALRGIMVVNGARTGVMEAVSKGAHHEHGEVLGVMRANSSFCNAFVSQTLVCDPNDTKSYELGLNIRTGIMLESDGFIVILGPNSGPGTLKELVAIIESEIGSWNPKRPCAVLFPADCYISELASAFGISLKDNAYRSLIIEGGYGGWLKIFTLIADDLINFVAGPLP